VIHETAFDTLIVENPSPGVLWVALNRVDSANSRNQRMRHELAQVYDAIASDSEIRVMVLTGSGDRFFCAGMDLKEAGGAETPLGRRERLTARRDIEDLARLPIPTIAAINGFALGGGLEMALACDLRIIADHAKIGLTELGHGLVPGGGGTQRLPRLVGFEQAAAMIYTGSTLLGADAVAAGLAREAVPGASLRERTLEVAGAIAAQDARALRAAKRLLIASQELPLSQGIERELDELLFLLAERQDASARAATNGTNGSHR
jgi:enoyl-CoA hydratase/carnithine racemase